MKNILLFLLSSLTLIGCAFDKDDALNQGKDLQERAELNDLYSPIIGTYEGLITDSDGRTYPVVVGLMLGEESVGKTPDGRDRSLPVLKALFRRLDVAIADINLKPTYLKNGDLVLNNTSDSTKNQIETLRGAIIGQRLTGDVSRSTGYWGRLDAVRTKTVVEAPKDGPDNDLNRRLREQYNKVVGVYEGKVSPDPRVAPPLFISVQLSIQGATPQLVATLDFEGDRSGNSRVTRQSLNVTYRPELVVPEIIMSNNSPGRSTNYFTTLDGVVGPTGDLTGSFSNQDGYIGEFVLKKVR